MDSPTNNAAVHYRSSFSLLSAFTPAVKQLLISPKAIPLDETVVALIDEGQPAIQEWMQATQLSECDWGFDLPTDFDAFMDTVGKGRQLATLLRLWVRLQFHRGLAQDAADALVRMFVMARHFGREGLYMAKLIQWAIENWPVDTAATHLQGLGDNVCRDMATRLRALPEVVNLAEAVRREKRLTERQTDATFQQEMTMADHEMVWRMCCTPTEVWLIRRAVDNDLNRLETLEQEMIPLFDRIAEIMELPLDRSQAALVALLREHRSTNPLIIYMVRSVEKLRYGEVRALVRFAQLQAALAIRLKDGEAWAAANDPFTGKAFGYRAFQGGFELTSPLQRHGQPPLVLTVGEKEGWIGKLRRLLIG